MFYKNARIYCDDFQFRMGAFEVKDGKFGRILPENVPKDAIDLNGAIVFPGLIDIHSHGNSSADFSNGDYEGIKKMAAFYAKEGVTSFTPASMTLPYNVLAKAFGNAKRLPEENIPGLSVLRGIQMEGPYFSYKKRGAQNADYLKEPDFEGFKALYESCDGLIRIVDIAPELPGAAEFTKKACKLCTVSVAHTDSGYDDTKAVFYAGARHLTYLYNAMPPVNSRNPGVIPAASENPNVQAEIICDGYHIHPSSVRLAFAMFPDRMVPVSDSGRYAGMEERSAFELGGQTAYFRGGVAKLADGMIACSVATLWQCLRNTISWGIPEEDAIRAATFNPAKVIGAENVVGSITEGEVADFIICNSDYAEKSVFLAGIKL